MWLINTSTLQLEFFINPKKDSYIILSHTWGNDEIIFAEFHDLDSAENKGGFDKIVRTCEIARHQGIRYAWVDTCCIDKSSSAELSEAINSMFEWYKNSAMCLVYLEDLPDHVEFEQGLGHCRWLTRGWTLQELIAPQHVHFFDQKWNERATKAASTTILAEATGVSADVLADSAQLAQIVIAQRMSWASNRETTRVEDIAYCMLGIFDIHMSLIYGEGERAFTRLQEEIAKQTCDLSLFAWASLPPEPSSDPNNYRGVLARSPREFASCRELMPRNRLPANKEFTVTNRGLRIEATLIRVFNTYPNDLVLNLGVSYRNPDDWSVYSGDGWIGVFLRKSVHGYVRVFAHTRYQASSRSGRVRCPKAILYIPKSLGPTDIDMLQKQYTRAVQFRILTPTVEFVQMQPADLWDHQKGVLLSPASGLNAYCMLKVAATEEHGGFDAVLACSTMSTLTCIVWTEQDGSWAQVRHFLGQAEEVTDYVAVDYLLRDLVAKRDWGKKVATGEFVDSKTGYRAVLEARLSEATIEQADGYLVELNKPF